MNKTIKIQKKIKKNNMTKKHVKKNTTHIQDILKILLQFQVQIKFLHWKTNNFPIHKITDDFHNNLSEKIDELVEICIGQNIELKNVNTYYNNLIELKTEGNFKDDKTKTIQFSNKLINVIGSKNTEKLSKDIQAVLDEILVEINRFKYLINMV